MPTSTGHPATSPDKTVQTSERPAWVSSWEGWTIAAKLSYLLACEQPLVKITSTLHAITYRWCRDPQPRERNSARGRYVVCGNFIAYPAVVDDFGSLVRVPS